ncbi:hypothetical protein MDA_GLEAN10019283 [Myotis davidii]|uniref:Uncharacterized protein n=1 Tax=Myotis davidii TaxID=225400 RepID=L5LK46_MYODS|nr:hypothetical protein MDA_GLEAN10019283 [Myotis davidii]
MGVPTPVVSTCVRGGPGVCARVIGVRSRSVLRLSQRSPGNGSGRDWLLLPRLRDVPGSASPYLRAAPRGASLGAQGAHPSKRRHQLPPKRPATPHPPPLQLGNGPPGPSAVAREVGSFPQRLGQSPGPRISNPVPSLLTQ